MSPQLFVVVSTGQNVANLPPLLEHANAGDRVLWIESAEARRRNWSAGARFVLEGYGLVPLPDLEVEDLNDPAQVVTAFKRYTAERPPLGETVYVIANGGLKLTPIGLLLGLQELNRVVLYGDDKPAVYRSFPGTFSTRPTITPYSRHDLDLPDILRASGHELLNREEALRIWPDVCPDSIQAEPYGQDVAFTRRLHSSYHTRGSTIKSGAQVHFDALTRLLSPERLERWRRAFHQVLASRDPESPASLATLYHATRNLAEDAAEARDHAAAGASQSEALLRDSFERAVALRVHKWLEQHRPRAVQSAWFNVRVGEEGSEIAQLDVALVLRNGVLLHIECKSFAADQKDLDARLLNLQTASSQPARMAVCGPLLTESAGEPWFQAQHALRHKIEERRRVPFLPFTLAGQPATYSWPIGGGIEQPQQCPSFEDSLHLLLRPYEPPPS